MSPHDEWMCGEHRMWMEAPDLLRMEMHGTLDLPSAEAYLGVVDEIDRRFGTVSFLVDMRDLGSIPPESRLKLSRVERPYPYHAIAVYGASFALTTIATMIVKAGRVLTPSAYTFEIAFFRTEAKAREHLTPFRHPSPQGR